uniref:Uncharacterized protein n=1 Tax=Romanomermis culicivorax TaxID=13658 RepID=A0A915IUV7_ROMCU
IPVDIPLHQPAANAAPTSSIAQSALTAGASTATTVAQRPTWSTRIGPTTAVTVATSSANATTAAVAVPVGSSSAAANYFASIVNQDFPKLSNESEKVVSAGLSLRPQIFVRKILFIQGNGLTGDHQLSFLVAM